MTDFKLGSIKKGQNQPNFTLGGSIILGQKMTKIPLSNINTNKVNRNTN